MASISSKRREPGKFNKRCLTLDEKIKILDVVKKRKVVVFLKHFFPKALHKKGKNVKVGKSQSKEWQLLFLLGPMMVKSISQ